MCTIYFKKVLILLLLEAGDVERNPGPNTIKNSLSILHCNIRSIRNKLDYITENLLDFDILCFSESHLDANTSTESLIMSSKYDIPYRKDRTNHGGGLLMYLSCELAHTLVSGLETFWNESLWVEIKVNRDIYLIGLFYSLRTADTHFFDSLNKNIEKALDTTNNIIILGDLNEDLFNQNMHNLKDVLLINSLHNIVADPTRQLALLDPIILHEDMTRLNQGIIVIESSSFSTNVFIEFAKLCIPNKTIVVGEDDKPWYDSEIRRNSRKRDRIKKSALKSGNPNDWNKYKYYRNKVNNLKKHAKESFL